MGSFYILGAKEEKLRFELPEAWTVSLFIEEEKEASITAEELAERALSKPIGFRSIEQTLQKAKKIAILIDDDTRPTPVLAILKVLSTFLDKTQAEVSIIVALGTHDKMSEERLKRRIGEKLYSKYKVIQHDAKAQDLIPFNLSEKKKVKINRFFFEADFRIGISSVLPHPMAGFGGGPKIVMPGVCDFEFIKDHHMKFTIHPNSKYGILEGNPFFNGIKEVAEKVGLNLSVNCLYDKKGRLVEILAGDPLKTFLKAKDLSIKTLGISLKEKVDITISSSYPHIHGVQFAKGLNAPDLVTKKDGAIILFLPIKEPLPEEFIESIIFLKETYGEKLHSFIKEKMEKGEMFLPEKPLEFNMALSYLFFRESKRTILVSPFLKEEEALSMGFEYAHALEEAIAMVKRDFFSPSTAIFPAGGFLIPFEEP